MRHTLHVLLRSCRESCCAAVFVVCCTASFAQGVPEPLSDQSVIQQLDSLRGLEVAFRYLAGFFEQVKSREFLTLTVQIGHEEDQIH